jgi:hypothetical protein
MGNSQQIALSTNGFKQIPFHQYVNDFTFIVDSCRYDCPRIVADFLSPRICDLHSTDPTAHEFSIQTQNPNNEFAKFLQFGFCQTVDVPGGEWPLYRYFASELANQELIDLLVARFEGSFTLENALGRLKMLRQINGDLTLVTEFVASHFSEFSPTDLHSLAHP